jgi:hypothetical protein
MVFRGSKKSSWIFFPIQILGKKKAYYPYSLENRKCILSAEFASPKRPLNMKPWSKMAVKNGSQMYQRSNVVVKCVKYVEITLVCVKITLEEPCVLCREFPFVAPYKYKKPPKPIENLEEGRRVLTYSTVPILQQITKSQNKSRADASIFRTPGLIATQRRFC